MPEHDHLQQLIDVLATELRIPRHERASGATDEGLRSAIIDARRAMRASSADVVDARTVLDRVLDDPSSFSDLLHDA